MSNQTLAQILIASPAGSLQGSEIIYGIQAGGDVAITPAQIRAYVEGALTSLTIATGTITVDTAAINITQTWNSGGTAFVPFFMDITDTASSGASYVMDLQVNDSTVFSIQKGGIVTMQRLVASSHVICGDAAILGWAESRTQLFSPADGLMMMQNNAGTDFGRLQFGGTTSAFPSIARSGTKLQAKLSDASGFCAYEGIIQTIASATAAAGFNLPSGTAPTAPVDGDIWYDGTNLKVRLAGVTKTVTVA